MALDWWVRLLRHLMARLCGGTRAGIASGSLHQIAVPCLGLNFEGLQNGSILAAPHRSSVIEVDFLLSPRSLSILVTRALGFGFGLLLFVAFLVCACRPGVRARYRVFYFATLVIHVRRPGGWACVWARRPRARAGARAFYSRDACNLCSLPGWPGLFSIL